MLKFSNNTTIKYLHDIAVEQLKTDYKKKGYKILESHEIGNYTPDIIMKKKSETIVIEVNAGKISPEKKKKILSLHAYAKENENYRFRIVLAKPPEEKLIDVDELNVLLEEHFSNDIPPELDALSTHSDIEDVYDIDIHKIKIEKNGHISVSGTGIVSVELQFGSNKDVVKDMGDTSSESFSFTFDLTLSFDDSQSQKRLVIHEINEIVVDIPTYYK